MWLEQIKITGIIIYIFVLIVRSRDFATATGPAYARTSSIMLLTEQLNAVFELNPVYLIKLLAILSKYKEPSCR